MREVTTSHPKETPARVTTSRAGLLMKLPKHRQFTTKRRKALATRFLAWVSALTMVFTLVKLLVEIMQMIHH